ncbi:MAG: FHA domain-containing protein [Deltaproteobacteria bacterium]|nr:FHA domain-containing protein [Candidatus Zymogenaceae bacterium]
MKQVFLIIGLDGGTKRFETSRPLITVGRRKRSDIVLKGARISRDHGFFKVNGAHLDYHDTSSNGTFINGELVKNDSRNIVGGDIVEFWGESITVLSKVIADIRTPPGGIPSRAERSRAQGKGAGGSRPVMPEPATSIYRNIYRSYKLRGLAIFVLYAVLPLWIIGLIVHIISSIQASLLSRKRRAVVVGRRLLSVLWIWAPISLVLGLFLLTRNFPECVVSRYIMGCVADFF